MEIDIDEVIAHFEQRNKWNNENLSDVSFVRDGKNYVPTVGDVEDFKFCGLSNTDFILMYEWDNLSF